MPNYKKIRAGLLALTIVLGVQTGQAQENKPEKQAAAIQGPITIEANELSFSDETGDILAKGNVVITNQGQRVEAEQINGNAKLSEIWINEGGRFTAPGAELTGSHTLYNYKLKTGSMEEAHGKVGRKYVGGKNISMFPGQFTINQGTSTDCPAEIPDYHVSAEKIEIWPGDKLIAYNAKFWIKNTVIFTLPKYRQSLKPGESSIVFPRIGYDNDAGVYIKQHIDYPFNDKLSAYINLDYYSKDDFKPSYGLINRETNYSYGVTQGHYRDSDNNWIKKEPEFKLSYNPRRLGNWPVEYTFTAIYGKWSDTHKSSWHQDYTLYFRHDPIKLDSSMNLYLGTGLQHVRESYDGSAITNIKYDATVDKRWSEQLNTWVGYHYNQHNVGLFEYEADDISRELAAGFIYKIDRMNAIEISQSYDLDNKRLADIDYTWYRNMHCWEAKLTYRAKRDEIRFDVSAIRW